MERWHHFARNAGRRGVARTVILHAAILLITAGATLERETWFLPLVAVLCWLLPALLRKQLAAAPEKTQRVLNVCAIVIVVGAFAAGLVREQIDDDILLHAIIGALSAYTSAYFWFLSDPVVVRLPPR